MSLWTVLKLIIALCVLGIMAFTGMLAWHVAVRPLGGIFEKIIPKSSEESGSQPDADFAKMLDSAELPDIDPGERAFQKAHELLALGKTNEAREKLNNIISSYPTSSSTAVARRIVGEMNLDEILSSSHLQGKSTHIVKRGNSFLGIVGEHHTTLDCLMHLNSMMELKSIQPGDEFMVMPLDFDLIIDSQRKTVSVWEGARFIVEYPVIHLGVTGKMTPGKTKIGAKLAELDGKQVAPQSKLYRAAEKVVQIAKPALQIRGGSETDEGPHRGIVLRPEDMEELSLLTRVGNDVEIR